MISFSVWKSELLGFIRGVFRHVLIFVRYECPGLHDPHQPALLGRHDRSNDSLPTRDCALRFVSPALGFRSFRKSTSIAVGPQNLHLFKKKRYKNKVSFSSTISCSVRKSAILLFLGFHRLDSPCGPSDALCARPSMPDFNIQNILNFSLFL